MASAISPTDISDLKSALKLTVGFGLRSLGALAWEPAPGSEADAEVNNTLRRPAGAAWGQNPPRTAYAAANLMMTGVLDNLVSLQALLRREMTSLGPVVLSRSVIEISSTAWWLMEPGIGVRARVCRELVLSLTSAQRAGQLAQTMQAGPAATEAAQQEAQILQRIAGLGIAAPTGGRFNQSIEGERAKSATDATTATLKDAVPAGQSAEPVYRAYSAVAHGEFYGLMNFMVHDTLPDGSPFLRWDVNLEVVDSAVQIALFAFKETITRIHKVMGWGKLERDLWEINLRRILN